MRTTLRTMTAIAAAALGWAVAEAALACPVGKPVLANGSPGVAVRAEGSLCRVRFVTGVELDYEPEQVVKATPADSRTERPVPGANLPIAVAVRGGARLCRPGVEVVHKGERATVTSVRTENERRLCTLRPEGAPLLALKSPLLEAAEDELVPAAVAR